MARKKTTHIKTHPIKWVLNVQARHDRQLLEWLRGELLRAEEDKSRYSGSPETRLYTYRLGICDAYQAVMRHIEEELVALGYEESTGKEG